MSEALLPDEPWWMKLPPRWRNVGTGPMGIVRSGQPSKTWLWRLHAHYKFKSIINLSFAPERDPRDKYEYKWTTKKGIEYHRYHWPSSSPPANLDEFYQVITLVKTVPKPVWIHCQGGRDRTGAVVTWIRRELGHDWESIIEQDFKKHGTPNHGWLAFIFAHQHGWPVNL